MLSKVYKVVNSLYNGSGACVKVNGDTRVVRKVGVHHRCVVSTWLFNVL